MKLPAFSSRHYQHALLEAGKVFLAVYGAIWLLVESFSFFVSTGGEKGKLGMFLACIALALCVAIVKALQKYRETIEEEMSAEEVRSVSHTLLGTDTSIEIQVGDLFEGEGAFIISTNTTFDTDMSHNPRISDSHLIHPDSLQGQFTQRYYPHKVHILDRELEEALENVEGVPVENPIGKSIRYDIGTVAKVHPKDQSAYLVAIADMDKNGKVSSHPEDVLKSLEKLWDYIRTQGGYGPLVIPVIGTGRARAQVKRDQMILAIIKSFVGACSKEKFSEKLTIVISENDYREHNIDLQALEQHLYVYATEERLQTQDSGRPIGESIE